MAKPKAKPKAKAKLKAKAKTKAKPKAKAKPRAKPKAKAKAKPKAKPAKAPAATLDPIVWALKGDVGAIYEIAAEIPDDHQRDVAMYKWLAIAADTGDEEAQEALDDMLETSTMRHDDDHGAQGHIHFELGIEYLTGTAGLPRNLEHGKAHLEHARRCNFPEQIQDGAKLVADARTRLDAEALAVFDAVYSGPPPASDDDEDDDDEDFAE